VMDLLDNNGHPKSGNLGFRNRSWPFVYHLLVMTHWCKWQCGDVSDNVVVVNVSYSYFPPIHHHIVTYIHSPQQVTYES
jgi:hypothetical protein